MLLYNNGEFQHAVLQVSAVEMEGNLAVDKINDSVVKLKSIFDKM